MKADGFFLGVICASAIFVIVLGFTWPHPPQPVVQQTDRGIVCKANRYYPKLDCQAIQAALGPRLNEVKVDK